MQIVKTDLAAIRYLNCPTIEPIRYVLKNISKLENEALYEEVIEYMKNLIRKTQISHLMSLVFLSNCNRPLSK